MGRNNGKSRNKRKWWKQKKASVENRQSEHTYAATECVNKIAKIDMSSGAIHNIEHDHSYGPYKRAVRRELTTQQATQTIAMDDNNIVDIPVVEEIVMTSTSIPYQPTGVDSNSMFDIPVVEEVVVTSANTTHQMSSERTATLVLNSQNDVRRETTTPQANQTITGDANNILDIARHFISDEEYNRIATHRIEEEKEPRNEKKVIKGYRIVQLDYLLNWVAAMQYRHSEKCTFGIMEPYDEDNRGLGLVSKITLKCTMCEYKYSNYTEDPKMPVSKVNCNAVWGTLSTGSTYTHLQERTAVMDIPCMNYNQFHEIEEKLEDAWKNSLWSAMEAAGKEERKLALKNKQLTTSGDVWISVYLDGGWSYRSYGHNYNAASGVAVIIGQATGKLLYLGVRNKYCSICARAANQDQTPHQHRCFQNWSGSSAAMEADIIVEGFNSSLLMHSLKYTQFIADGDSSVFYKIRQNVSYGQEVTKVECVNHAVQNYGKQLYAIKKRLNN